MNNIKLHTLNEAFNKTLIYSTLYFGIFYIISQLMFINLYAPTICSFILFLLLFALYGTTKEKGLISYLNSKINIIISLMLFVGLAYVLDNMDTKDFFFAEQLTENEFAIINETMRSLALITIIYYIIIVSVLPYRFCKQAVDSFLLKNKSKTYSNKEFLYILNVVEPNNENASYLSEIALKNKNYNWLLILTKKYNLYRYTDQIVEVYNKKCCEDNLLKVDVKKSKEYEELCKFINI